MALSPFADLVDGPPGDGGGDDPPTPQPAPAPAPQPSPFADLLKPKAQAAAPDSPFADLAGRAPAKSAAGPQGAQTVVTAENANTTKAGSYARAPIMAFDAAGGQLVRGATGLAELAGVIDEDTRKRVNESEDKSDMYREIELGKAPGATTAANLGGTALTFANPTMGALTAAGATAGQMRDQGADRSTALAGGALAGGAAAAMGPLGRVAGPVVAPLGEGLVARAAGGALTGAAQGALMSGGNVAAESMVDPEAARAQLGNLPADAALFGVLGAAHAGAARPERAQASPFEDLAKPFADAADRPIAPPPPEAARGAPLEPGAPEPVPESGPRSLEIDAQQQGAAELARMQDEAARSKAISDVAKQQAAENEQAARAEALRAEIERRRQWYEDNKDARLDWARRFLDGEATYEDAPTPPGQEPTNAAANHPEIPAGVRQEGQGDLLRDRQEAGPRPGDVQEAQRQPPEAVAQPRPEPAAAPPAAVPAAAPRAHQVGDRVRIEFKGSPVEGQIIGRAPEGRLRVQADDGRTFPAVAPERITSLEERRAPAPPASPAPEPPAPREAAPRAAAEPPLPRAAGAEPAPAAPRARPRGEEPLPPRMTRDQLRSQLDALPIAKRTPGLTDSLMAFVEARAKSAGLSPDEYVGRKFAGVRSEADRAALNQKDTLLQERQGTRLEVPSARLKHQYLLSQWKKAHGDRSPTPTDKDWQKLVRQADMVDEAQGRKFFQGDSLDEAIRGDSVKRGAVQFLRDGRAIIHAFQHADESTVLHELAHVFRRDLSGEDLAAVEEWAKVKGGNWTRAAEEKFARGFERYVRDGQAPTPQLKGVFQQFFHWLHNVYRSVTGSAINVDVSPAAKRVFDRLLTDDRVAKNVPREIPELPREERPTSPTAPTPGDRTQAPPLSGPGSDRIQNDRAAETAPAGAKPAASAPSRPVANQRPDLATPGLEPEARAGYVEARNQIGDVASRSREDIRTAAQKRVDKNADGELSKLLSKSRRGEAFNAEDMGVAQHLLDRLSGEPGRHVDFRRLSLAYHLAGNEGAVAMGMRVDRIQTPEGRAAEGRSLVALPAPRAARRMEQLRQLLQKDQDALGFLEQRDPAAQKLRNRMKRYQGALDALEAKDAKRQAKDKAHLKSLGFDVDHADPEWAKDPDRFAQFVAALDATKGGLPAVARELYVGAAHMSGTVFGKKILADLFNVPAAAARRGLEAVVGEAKRAVGLGKANEASFRELRHMWRAISPAFAKARANAAEALISEQHPKELMGPEDTPFYPAMRGIPGKVIRQLSLMPTVRAIDAFTRSLVAHVEVAGQAYRSGAHLGDAELGAHMDREVSDFHSESWGKAREEAMRATFMEKPIAPVRAFNRLKYQQAHGAYRKAVKFGANVLEPFTTIPSNIATQGLAEWTPGLSDAITVMKALRRGEDGEWLYDGNKFNRDVAQAILRWGSAATFATAAANGYITGANDERNPDSINLFGHHFSYRFLGPIGRAIGAAADVFAPQTGKKPDPAAMRVLKGSWERFGEMPLIRLGQDVVRMAVQEHEGKDGILRFLADHTAGFMEPSIVHQAINAQADEVRTKASFSKKTPPPAYERFAAYLKDRMTSNSGKPVYIGGKPLVKDSFDSPLGTLLWRIAMPLPLGNKEPERGPETGR
jgi:hypothetical protein